MATDTDLGPADGFDALGDRADVVAGVSTVVVAPLLPSGNSELPNPLGGNLWRDLIDARHRALGIAPCLLANGVQFGDARFERRIAPVDEAVLDRFLEPRQPGFGFARPPHLTYVPTASLSRCIGSAYFRLGLREESRSTSSQWGG